MNCKIEIKDSKGNVLGSLSKEAVEKLALNTNGNITKQDILLYELETVTDDSKTQDIVINIIKNASV